MGNLYDRFRYWLIKINPAIEVGDFRDKVWTKIIWPFFKCHECYDGVYYPYYGVAPHVHELIVEDGKMALTTIMKEKSEWPKNYDDCDDGCGTWYCPNPKCKNGRK